MYPPVSVFAFREVPPGGDIINGFFVPAKTKLGYNFSGLARDPELWGDDAAIFRPERWLTKSLVETRSMEANIELVFGYGKWSCLGRKIAYKEMNKVLVQVCSWCTSRACGSSKILKRAPAQTSCFETLT